MYKKCSYKLYNLLFNTLTDRPSVDVDFDLMYWDTTSIDVNQNIAVKDTSIDVEFLM